MDSNQDNKTQQMPEGSNEPSFVDKAKMMAHKAAPGPVAPKEFNVQQEGTREERAARAKELNQKNEQ